MKPLRGSIFYVFLAFLIFLLYDNSSKLQRSILSLVPERTLQSFQALDLPAQEATVRNATKTSTTDLGYLRFEDLPICLRRDGITPYRNLMEEDMPAFLPNYKTPCWREEYDAGHWDIRLNCLPYLYLAGLARCGTTDLFHTLSQHPLIVSTHKEFHWWSKKRVVLRGDQLMGYTLRDYTNNFRKAINTLEAYNMSSEAQPEGYHPMMLIDGSPSTLFRFPYWKEVPENQELLNRGEFLHNGHYIQHVTPQARVIVIFRNPINRVYSTLAVNTEIYAYKKMKDIHKGFEEGIKFIHDCLKNTTLWICANRKISHTFGLLQYGIYYTFVEQWLRVFPRDQVYFARLEDYSRDRANILNEIYMFLGLDPLTTEQENVIRKIDVRNAHPELHHKLGPLMPKTQTMLENFFRPYNEMLARLLEDDKWLFEDS